MLLEVLRASCAAKSDACHHSRNFRKKMPSGSMYFKAEMPRGNSIRKKTKGDKEEFGGNSIGAAIDASIRL